MNKLPAKLCDVCLEPGKCCKRFALGVGTPFMSFWKNEATILHALVRLTKHDLPMVPLEKLGPYKADDGREYYSWVFTCPELTPAGRCGIYEHRPQVCRDYIPASSTLCFYG